MHSVYNRTDFRFRLGVFIAMIALILVAYCVPLMRLIQVALHEGYSSHIVLVPLIVIYLVWQSRADVFRELRFSFLHAAIFGICAIALLLAARLSQPTILPTLVVGSVLCWVAAFFIAMFGAGAFGRAIFPLALMLFAIPLPGNVLGKILYFLQYTSADLSQWLFNLLHVPVVRNGFQLTVPGVTVEVAAECSGINSSLALLILMILFAQQTLHGTWRRVALILLILPLSILKNAIRIVTLTMLALRVDRSFLTGNLHHRGGFVFFLVTLVLVYPIWKLLQKADSARPPDRQPRNEPISTAAAPLK